MSALTAPNAALKTKAEGLTTRNAKASTAIFRGGFLVKDANGDVLPLDTSAGAFVGIAGRDVLAAETNREIVVEARGRFLATLTGVTKADIGKPVYCSTDNPADATLAYGATAKLIGFVDDMEFDDVGAVSNKAWVTFDAEKIANTKVLEIAPAGIRTLVGSIEQFIYKCPTGKKAKIVALSYEYDVKPNYASSAVLIVAKVAGTTRTTALNAANVDINNTAVAVDTVTALTLTATAADLLLAAGNRLAAKATAAGSETAAGNVKVHAVIEEMPA